MVITTIKVPRAASCSAERRDSIFLCFIHGPRSCQPSPCPSTGGEGTARFCVISTEKAHNQITREEPQRRSRTETAAWLHCIRACSPFFFPQENRRSLDRILKFVRTLLHSLKKFVESIVSLPLSVHAAQLTPKNGYPNASNIVRR